MRNTNTNSKHSNRNKMKTKSKSSTGGGVSTTSKIVISLVSVVVLGGGITAGLHFGKVVDFGGSTQKETPTNNLPRSETIKGVVDPVITNIPTPPIKDQRNTPLPPSLVHKPTLQTAPPEFIDTTSSIPPLTTLVVNQPQPIRGEIVPLPHNSILTTVFDSSNKAFKAITLSSKRAPTIRQNYSLDCSYTQTFEKINTFIGRAEGSLRSIPFANNFQSANYVKYVRAENDEESFFPTDVVCLMLDQSGKLNNHFPVFHFNDIAFELANFDNSNISRRSDTSEFIVSPKKADKYKEVQNNAKKVVEFLLNNRAFSNELVLLDKVTFGYKVAKEAETHGLYRRTVHSTETFDYQEYTNEKAGIVQLSNNRRSISLKVDKTWSVNLTRNTPNLGFNRQLPVGSFYNKDGYEGIIMDLNALTGFFSHEYGHHITLFNDGVNRQIQKQEFLDKLKSLFPQDSSSSDKRREDFEKIYKYINNLGSKIKSDAELLKLVRKYFSKNIISLKDVFAEEYPDPTITPELDIENWRLRHRKLIGGIHDTNFIPKDIKDGIKEFWPLPKENVIDRVKYNAYRNKVLNGTIYNYHFYLLDHKGVHGTPTTGFTYNLLPVSDTYKDAEINTDKALTVSDIFPTMKTQDIRTPENLPSVQNCGETPYYYLNADKSPYGMTVMFSQLGGSTPFTKAKYIEASSNTDREMIGYLKYLYSYEELSARMSEVIGYTYDDGRARSIKACQFEVKDDGTFTLIQRKQLSTEVLQDYGLFKSFNINLFESEEKTRSLQESLFKKKVDLKNNQIKFRQGTYHSPGDTTDKSTKLFYSHNIIGRDLNLGRENSPTDGIQDVPIPVDNTLRNNNKIRGLNSIYMLARVKLDNPTDLSKLRITFEESSGNYRTHSAINYDYNHKTLVESNSKNYDTKLTNVNKDYEVDKLYDVVFDLPDLQYRIYTSVDNGVVKAGYEMEHLREFQNPSRSTIEQVYDNIYKVFIDNNNDNVFNAGDIEITEV